MPKSLEEMTNEELWKLFPIVISEHRSEWTKNYEQEEKLIKQKIGRHSIFRINHIGSTCVPQLPAKPTIDILLEITKDTKLEWLKKQFKEMEYRYLPQPDNPPPHMIFLKGYTPQGFKEEVLHVHVRYPGNWDELYFRDHLLSHPEDARAYGELKCYLSRKYKHDRDGYTKAKTSFIKKCSEMAKLEFRDKYRPF